MAITECPVCQGRPVNHPKSWRQSGPCELCGGRGVVDPDKICGCGRPVVGTIEGKGVCSYISCVDRPEKKT